MLAIVCKHTPPLGPMPNDDIDVKNLESLEKYRSYTPYLRHAEEAKNKQVWWKTYRGYLEKADPVNGEEEQGIFSLWLYGTVMSYLVKAKLSKIHRRLLLQMLNEWTLECHFIDPAGPFKWGRGKNSFRITKRTWNWKGHWEGKLVSWPYTKRNTSCLNL